MPLEPLPCDADVESEHPTDPLEPIDPGDPGPLPLPVRPFKFCAVVEPLSELGTSQTAVRKHQSMQRSRPSMHLEVGKGKKTWAEKNKEKEEKTDQVVLVLVSGLQVALGRAELALEAGSGRRLVDCRLDPEVAPPHVTLRVRVTLRVLRAPRLRR
eukprot:3775127-Rhodomonas_salina.1